MATLLIKKIKNKEPDSTSSKIYIQDILDKKTNKTLSEILGLFNMLFLPYLGDKATTRRQIPELLRHKGTWITYVIEDLVVTEWYASDKLDDYNWGYDVNWRDGSNMLVGDISISTDGTWIVKGVDTKIKALGEQGIQGEKGDKGDTGNDGITPLLRIEASELQVSYDNGETWESLNIKFTEPDEEDITSIDNKLSLKDRIAENNLGYVILRKTKTFKEQVTAESTIYEVRYSFDLNNETVELPDNCTLLFNGGKLSNGTLKLNNTYIINANKSFDKSLILQGTVYNSVIESVWWDIDTDDCYKLFRQIINISNESKKSIYFSKDTYTIINDGEEEPTITLSIDFNDSTFIFNTGEFENFKINISNSVKKEISSADLALMATAINNRNYSADVFKKYKNTLITVDSNDTEIIREHTLVQDPVKKKEILYVDMNGFLYNTPFNDSINVVGGSYISCSEQIYIKNLHLEIDDLYKGTLSGAYRYIGFYIYNSSNVEINNIIIPDPNIEKHRLVFLNVINCYNVIYRNCLFTNTRNNNSLINNDKSAYVFLGLGIIKLLFDNINIGNLTADKVWGATGCNYITDWTIINSSINRIDIHYRLNNLYIDNCVIGDYGVTYTGFGNIIIKNTKFTGNYILSPRLDYGSFFGGDILIDNCEILNRIKNGRIFILYSIVNNFAHSSASLYYKFFGAKNITVKNLVCNNASTITPIRVYTEVDLQEYSIKRIYPNIIIDGLSNIKLKFDVWKYLYYVFDKDYKNIINIRNYDSLKYAEYYGFSELYQFSDIITEFPVYQNNASKCNSTILNIYDSTNLVAGIYNNNTTMNIYNSTITMLSGRFTVNSTKFNSLDNQINVYNSTFIASPDIAIIPDIMNQGFYYNCRLSAISTDSEEWINHIKLTFYPIKLYNNGKYYLNNEAKLHSCVFDKVLADYLGIEDYINIDCYDKYGVKEVYVTEESAAINPLNYTYYRADESDTVDVSVKENIDKGVYRIRLFVRGTINLIFSNETKNNTCIELMIQAGLTGNSHVYLKDTNGDNINVDMIGSDLCRYPSTLLYKIIINPQTDGSILLTMNYPTNWTVPRATGSRYLNPALGMSLYDSDINMPIWFNGTSWVNAFGNSPDILTKGTTAQRPTLTSDNEGFLYFDTTLHEPIWWNGTLWIDGTNTPIE